MAAIARRRKLLNDDILIALADTSWEILDVSGSDVSDFGLIKAAEVCRFIKALDIRYRIITVFLKKNNYYAFIVMQSIFDV